MVSLCRPKLLPSGPRDVAAKFAWIRVWLTAFGFLALPACALNPLAGLPTDRSVQPAGKVSRPALTRALDAAAAQYPAVLRGESGEARLAYADAVGAVVRELARARAPREWKGGWNLPGYTLRVPDVPAARAGAPPIRLDEWTAIEPLPVRGRGARPRAGVSLAGVGVPVLLYRAWSDDPRTWRQGTSPNGAFRPATAVLELGPVPPGGGPRVATLRLYSTRDVQETVISGRRLPLAWDFATPIERQLTRGIFGNIALFGLFRPENNLRYAGLFLADSWDPTKIPVVFVHGLYSDPRIWGAAMTAVLDDLALREKYQLWFFVYPTGLPVPASAARLRRSLENARNVLDPRLAGGMRRTVLVGHSMGGLLTRLQVIDSGDDLWKAYFRKPPGELRGISSQTRETLIRALQFPRVPWVERSVFICTPHRGSSYADLGIVRLLTQIIKVPVSLVKLATEMLTFDFDAVNPQLFQFNTLGGQGVATLSPRHPFFPALARRPILVPYHSIIGDRGRGDTPNSSDGVVPYSSSHLDGARSETIVPAPHSATAHPQTVADILRILREHSAGKVERKIPVRAERGPRPGPPPVTGSFVPRRSRAAQMISMQSP